MPWWTVQCSTVDYVEFIDWLITLIKYICKI